MNYAFILALVIAAIGVNAENDASASSTVTSGPWWGSTDKDNDTSIRPFQIEFSQEMIDDLIYRLQHTRLSPSLENTQFRYGVNSAEMPNWLNYWATNYNFTARLDYLNQYPQYKVLSHGLDIHFIWIKQESCHDNTMNENVHKPSMMSEEPIWRQENQQQQQFRQAHQQQQNLQQRHKQQHQQQQQQLQQLQEHLEQQYQQEYKAKMQRRQYEPQKHQPMHDQPQHAQAHYSKSNIPSSQQYKHGSNQNNQQMPSQRHEKNQFGPSAPSSQESQPPGASKRQACEGKTVIPVLLLHGWPGSVREFYDIIPYLTEVSDERDYVLELVIPSLPGFGYSEAATIQGLGAMEIGDLFVDFMETLGYKEFIVQGGDWGSVIGSFMATRFPDRILGYHTNMAYAFTTSGLNLLIASSIYPGAIMDPSLVDRVYPLTRTMEWLAENSGYLHMQSSKPDTLGIGMTDSPAGLLAWIFQFFAVGIDTNSTQIEDGGMSAYNLESLIDNLMLYWSSGNIGPAFRIYAETFNLKTLNLGIFAEPTATPTCILQAKNEIIYMPPPVLNTKYTDIVNITVLDYGGHFLALQYPDVLADNLFSCISKIRESNTYVDE